MCICIYNNKFLVYNDICTFLNNSKMFPSFLAAISSELDISFLMPELDLPGQHLLWFLSNDKGTISPTTNTRNGEVVKSTDSTACKLNSVGTYDNLCIVEMKMVFTTQNSELYLTLLCISLFQLCPSPPPPLPPSPRLLVRSSRGWGHGLSC